MRFLRCFFVLLILQVSLGHHVLLRVSGLDVVTFALACEGGGE